MTDPSNFQSGRAFPSTQWSRILAVRGGRDLEALARSYWRPIRSWLRARLRTDEATAEDLAQDVFAWMLASRFFDRADPQRGRFRSFLKHALAQFAIDHLRRESAAKRGIARTTALPEAAHELADPAAPTPDRALDDAWRRELLQRARDELETELCAAGRATYFALFRDYFLDEGDVGDIDHAALAARYRIGRNDVANWLDYAKRRYRARLRSIVRETVHDADELEGELAWLFGATDAAGERAR